MEVASVTGMPCACGGYILRHGKVGGDGDELTLSARKRARTMSGAKAPWVRVFDGWVRGMVEVVGFNTEAHPKYKTKHLVP